MSGTKTCARGHTYSAAKRQCYECSKIAAEELRNGRRKNDTQGIIPSELVKPIVERAMREHGDQRTVSELTRVPERRLYEIRHGKVEKSSIDLVDRLLVGLNLLELWYLPAPDGFADWYVTDEPEPAPTPAPRPLRLITLYHKGIRTPETRAAMAAWKRNRVRRLKGLPAAEAEPRTCCRCGVNTAERTYGCRACLSRHSSRRLAGLPAVSRPPCSGCGVPLDERTDGCLACRQRHWKRAQRGAA